MIGEALETVHAELDAPARRLRRFSWRGPNLNWRIRREIVPRR